MPGLTANQWDHYIAQRPTTLTDATTNGGRVDSEEMATRVLKSYEQAKDLFNQYGNDPFAAAAAAIAEEAHAHLHRLMQSQVATLEKA